MDRAKTTTLTGAEIVVRCLQEEGVEYVFGYPGGAVLFIYDELFKQDKVKHVLVRHEQGAVHAADGYSRSSKKVGVCLVTSGPGVTNAVTGIATAYMDSIPLVVLTGQVPTHAIGLDAFQECDTVGITRPCVKHNFLVKNVRDLASTIKKAFHIAATGRPGPVLVDIPKDITTQPCEFHYPESVQMRSYNPVRKGHAGQIKKAVQLLLEAERPMVYTGGGVVLSDSSSQLRELVRQLGLPCTNTLMGLGAYPATDPQFLGMLGMHGTYEANMAMQHCDVLLAIGARFDDRVIGNPAHFAQNPRKIIHIDIDPSSISKRVKVDVPIVGNIPDVLEDLLKLLKNAQTKNLQPWWKQIDEWRAKDCLRYDRKSSIIKPQFVLEKLYEVTKGEAFVTSDVGQHQMWAAQFYKFNEPRRWINSGGLGTMGFGLPAAMGVQLANPGSDGGVRHRRVLHPDVPAGALHLQAIPPADQDHQSEQQVHGHGAPVAAVLPRQPLLRVVHGRAARLREARRGLRSPRRAHRQARRRRTRAARGFCGEKRPRVPRLHHRPEGKRLPDDPRRQGDHRDDPLRGFVSRHIISVLVENEAGALSRISGLFSARGYNIETLTVAPTEDASMSRMTIVTAGSEDVIEQITKQLNKLIEVVKVIDLSEAEHIERELMLIKVRAGQKEREDMKRMADIFRGRIIDVSDNTYTIELTGDGAKLDAFIRSLDQGTIIETVRTGASGIGRGNRVLRV
jgi:acetolactate synthase-1/2/3 large subunit